MRRLSSDTREALEREIVNLEYDKTRIDAQIKAIRNLLAHMPTTDTAPAEEPYHCECGSTQPIHHHCGIKGWSPRQDEPCPACHAPAEGKP